MDLKYCKHCRKAHPLTPEYWYKNGGKLAKCKAYYSSYEKKRYKYTGTSTHYKVVRSVRESLTELGIPSLLGVKYGNNNQYLADLVLPRRQTVIEIKSEANIYSIPKHEEQYREHFKDYTILFLVYDSGGSYDINTVLDAIPGPKAEIYPWAAQEHP